MQARAGSCKSRNQGSQRWQKSHHLQGGYWPPQTLQDGPLGKAGPARHLQDPAGTKPGCCCATLLNQVKQS